MSSFKVYAVLLLANVLQIHCSVLAPAVSAPWAVPAIRYTLVAPQNIRPFAAQVSTFAKGLSVFQAPYAAGVIGGPAIVPAPALAPAVAPGPYYPAVAPAGLPAAAPALASGPYYPAVGPAALPAAAPGPLYPASLAAPWHSGLGSAVAPAAAPAVAPAPLLPAPFARSVHAVTPGAVHWNPHLHY